MSTNFLNPKRILTAFFRLGNHLPPPLRRAFHWKLFCTPFVHARSSEQLHFLSQGKPAYVPSGSGHLLPVWLFGQSGPTAVLCHGWQGSAASWYVLAPMLIEAGFRVIVFHAPGHHHRPRKSSLPDFSQALSAVVGTFGADVLVGHSFGALTVARALPDMPDIKRAALISSPDRLEDLVAGFCRNLKMTPIVEDEFFRYLGEKSPLRLEQEAASIYLQNSSCPLVLVHDEDDEVIPVSCSEAIEQSRDCLFHRTEGLGHRLIIRDEQNMRKVADFLSAV